MKRKKLLSVLMTALTALLCVALIVSVVSLYARGVARKAASGSAAAPIFTWEDTARQLLLVSPALGLWALCAAVCALTGNLSPRISFSSVRREKTAMRGRMETAGRVRLRLALYGVSAALLVLGVLNGGLRDVLIKAINICTECIGLG